MSSYGKENQTLIAYFVFMLRSIVLSILICQKIPKYLPKPDEIDEIAYTIQIFLEKNAWNAYILKKDMHDKKIFFQRHMKNY